MVFGNDVFANQLVPVQSSSNHCIEPPKCQRKNPAHVSKLFRQGHIHLDFSSFIRLIVFYNSPFSQAISVNCVGSKSPPGSPAKSSSSMSATSFGSGCCEAVRCDAACMPGGCFQDVLHGKIVFTFHLFQARSSCLCQGLIIHQEGLNLHDGMKVLLDELVTSLGQVGLKLNTSKTQLLMTQAQPRSSFQTSGEVTGE